MDELARRHSASEHIPLKTKHTDILDYLIETCKTFGVQRLRQKGNLSTIYLTQYLINYNC